MKEKVIIGVLFLTFSTLQAQIIERQVVATGGDYWEANGIQLSHTIGEPIPEYFLQSNTHLTQGFQQGELQDIVLPIELLTFQAARMNEEAVTVSWDILEIKDVHYFILERKLTGEASFQNIATIDKEEALDYTFTDKNNAFQNSYYRLKLVELDGAFSYSNIEVVAGIPLQTIATIFPNPFADEASLLINHDERFNFEKINISIFNHNGQLVFNQVYPFKNGEIALPIFQKMPAGNYLIQLDFDNILTEQIKVSKI